MAQPLFRAKQFPAKKPWLPGRRDPAQAFAGNFASAQPRFCLIAC
jgi:hypothetical protein